MELYLANISSNPCDAKPTKKKKKKKRFLIYEWLYYITRIYGTDKVAARLHLSISRSENCLSFWQAVNSMGRMSSARLSLTARAADHQLCVCSNKLQHSWTCCWPWVRSSLHINSCNLPGNTQAIVLLPSLGAGTTLRITTWLSDAHLWGLMVLSCRSPALPALPHCRDVNPLVVLRGWSHYGCLLCVLLQEAVSVEGTGGTGHRPCAGAYVGDFRASVEVCLLLAVMGSALPPEAECCRWLWSGWAGMGCHGAGSRRRKVFGEEMHWWWCSWSSSKQSIKARPVAMAGRFSPFS